MLLGPMFGDEPSDKLLLNANVFIIIRALVDLGNIHDEVYKSFCFLAKEVQ